MLPVVRVDATPLARHAEPSLGERELSTPSFFMSFEPPPDTQNEQDAWFDAMASDLSAPSLPNSGLPRGVPATPDGFIVDVAGQEVRVTDLVIDADYGAGWDFKFMGHEYQFEVVVPQYLNFLQQFMAFEPREHEVFGSVLVKENGMRVALMGPSHIEAMLRRCVFDIMKHLGDVLAYHQRSILEYACWYADVHGWETYAEWVQYTTCECIRDSAFLTRIDFTVVKFE
jgi:hypothetical protein